MNGKAKVNLWFSKRRSFTKPHFINCKHLFTFTKLNVMWYGIILIAGILLLGIGALCFKKTLYRIKNGSLVSGTVVELESYQDRKKDVLYRPVFAYKAGYAERTFVYNVGSKPPAWKVGEKANLVIDPNNAEKVMVLTYFGAFGWTLVLVAVALPMIVIGAGYFWARNFFQQLLAASW